LPVLSIEKWQELEATRQPGEIDFIRRDKGYGFVSGQDGNRYFWHLSALMDRQFTDLEIGDKITFALLDGGHPGGPAAEAIYFDNDNNNIKRKGENDNEL